MSFFFSENIFITRIFLIIFSTICFIVLAFFLYIVLDFNYMSGDVIGYWEDSLEYRTPFHRFHVPGYPFFIAIIRGISFHNLSPIAILLLINYITYIVSIYLVFKILFDMGGNQKYAIFASIFFGLWPFIGVVYTVFPLADSTTVVFFLLGLFYLTKSNSSTLSGIFFGISMITHKVMWIFVFFILLNHFINKKRFITISNLKLIVVTFSPLFILWILGSFYHHSIIWIVSSNINVEVSSHSNLLFFDGLLGTFLSKDVKSILKGLILISFFTISLLTLYFSIKIRYPLNYYGVAISTSIIILFIVLNQHEIWAAIRFSKLLAIPISLILLYHFKFDQVLNKYKYISLLSILLLLASQFIYSWYMATIFYT
jgi:hypothetical protein